MNQKSEHQLTKAGRANNRSSQKFIANPSRAVEWLGGVNYDRLSNTIERIKELLQEDPLGEIQLLVNSYGGATAVGMNFFDTMQSWYKPNLTTIGSGDVDSSGVIVFLAGKKRYITRNTTMLLHLGGRTFESNKRFSSKDMENMLREDRLRDYQYACVLSDATLGRATPERILELMSADTILTAEEAVNMGLAHKVI
jgi:ATP-dependent Clp protease, protease subunit